MSDQHVLEKMVVEKQLSLEASKITTAPLLRKGWTLVLSGWGIGLIPLLGVVGWILALASGVIIGVVVMTRGNTSGGQVLAVTGWFGTAAVALVSLLVWMLFGISSFGFLGAMF